MQHPASFRDPDSVVLIDGDAVIRSFRNPEAYDETLRAMKAPFARRAVADGALIDAEPATRADGAGNLKSRRIPFIADPREWSFEMRRDAALLTLRLSTDALSDGFEMKDATSYNVAFDGCRPVFFDHGSFRESYSGHWPGYSQFGDHFVNPLLVEAHAGVTAQQLGFSVEGIPVGVARAASRGRGRLKKGAFSWVFRRALAERVSGGADQGTAEQLSSAALPREAVTRIMEKATALVTSLDSSTPSFWRDYEEAACPYDDEQMKAKMSLVGSWIGDVDGRDAALDVGCNIGTFSEILAGHFERVVAIDNDPVAIDRLYRRGSQEPWGSRVTPAVVDMAQPTPAIGWMNRERASFLDRLGVVDVSVWLAVIHHLMLTGGIPLPQILDLIAAISRFAIIEHIAPEDGSVKTMTAGRRWAHVPDFDEFRAALDKGGFSVTRSEETSPTRTLVLVRCPR